MTDIPFTSIDYQIDKLLSQNLIINDIDYAKYSLELFGYSNLIKSYREPYVFKTETSIQYRAGVTFEQINSLYILDKNLRNSVMSAMQDLEEHIKETAASVVSEAFGTNEENYLAYRNYRNVKKRKKRFTLPGILDTLKKTLDTDKNPIHHYAEKYGNVPPWILFKSIYFSTIINFIDLFKKDELVKMANKLYDNKRLHMSDEALCTLMMDTLFICLDYRNTAAHGGRIYNHKCQYNLHSEKIFGDKKQPIRPGFSQLLFLLSLLDYNKPFLFLHASLEHQISKHCSRFPQDTTYLGQILNMNIIPRHIVYVTKNSNKFHSIEHCSGIKEASEIDLEKAQSKGYVPCKRCIKSNQPFAEILK